MRPGLERMQAVLERLGQPQQSLRVVHLAGTNGKGSTAAMLEACLRAAGVRAGLYTSPHLCRFTERIQVAGQEIPPGEVARWCDRLRQLEPGLTFFEAATAMALGHFASASVELAVVETGLGGRLDATNVVQPVACVLTHLGLDHLEQLGPTLAHVAREKAGIIKPAVPVVSAPLTAESELVVRGQAQRLGAPLAVLGQDFDSDEAQPGCGLEGAHQQQNAALCLATLELLAAAGVVSDLGAARGGLSQVRWPGRMERVGGQTVLDGAHNPDGTRALARALVQAGSQDLCLVLGVLGPREIEPLVAPLRPLARRIICTQPRSARAVPAEQLAAAVGQAEVVPDLEAALALSAGEGDRLITGSLYLVGQARALLCGERVDPVVTADPR